MIAIPARTRCSVHVTRLPEGKGCWTVLLADEAAAPLNIDAIAPGIVPGTVSAVLLHDRGVTFPDAKGIACATAALAEGGAVALLFVTLADALECQRQMRKAGAT